MLVQKITTRRPTDDMIEVAIVSMQEALGADDEAIPDGSTRLAYSPIRLGMGQDTAPGAESVTVDPADPPA
jgi:hypothetical protein